MFEIQATKNNLIVRTKELLTSGSVQIYTVKFRFNGDWDGLIKVAWFRAGGVVKPAVPDAAGECEIPWEVLAKPCYRLEVGVIGTKDDPTVLPTIWTGLGVIREGAEPGDDAREPTPSVYQQLMAQLDEGRKAAEDAADRALASEQAAQDAAQQAEDALGAAAWVGFELGEDGCLYAVLSPGFTGAQFALTDDGYLEVIYG